jgi:hypothetical protein
VTAHPRHSVVAGQPLGSVSPVDLDPSLVDERTYLTRRRTAPVDVAVVVSVMIALLMLLPSRLTMPGLSDFGRPALVLCSLMWFWWGVTRLHPRLVMAGPQPMRWLVASYLGASLLSYAAGYLRGLTTAEASGADRAILMGAAFTGLILVVADGITIWERLAAVLAVFVWCGTGMAVVGLSQYAFRGDPHHVLDMPGLQLARWTSGVEAPSDGVGVAGTAAAPAEFGAVMALVLPFALHFALRAPTRRGRIGYGIASALIFAVVPSALPRTGMIDATVVCAVLMIGWMWRSRAGVIGVAAVIVGVVVAVSMALIATVRVLYAGNGTARGAGRGAEPNPAVAHYVDTSFWLGRGSGTWVATRYPQLGNQWLSFMVTNGVVGVVILTALHLTAIGLSLVAWRRSTTAEDRHLCLTLVSAHVVVILVVTSFDWLSFTTCTTAVALMLGLAGVAWRLTHPARQVRTSIAGW